MNTETRFLLDVGTGRDVRQIAINKFSGHSPGLVWLGGFHSDMTGTKAQAMVEWACDHEHSALRFDYSGHGQSSGDFLDGTISRWLEESLAVLDHHTDGPQILVGSSMGGWIALRMAQELSKHDNIRKICGLILIAPAPDFTKELMEPEFSPQQWDELASQGFISEPSEYSDEPNIITRALIEDGRKNLTLDGIINIDCPVRILQGMQDPDVPFEHSMRLVNHLQSDDVTVTLIKDGDHRLSRDKDICLLKRALDEITDVIS